MTTLKLVTIALILMRYVSFGQDTLRMTPVLQRPSTLTVHPSIDFYFTTSQHGKGFGFGMGGFSKGMEIAKFNSTHPVHLCLGGDLYFLRTQRKDLGYLTMYIPDETYGNLRVTQSNFGLNIVARFLFICTPKIKPYVDVFIGARGFSSDVYFSTSETQTGRTKEYEANLSGELHWNYGTSVGLLYALNKHVNLNFAFMLTSSDKYGLIDNVNEARYENGDIKTERVNTPLNMGIIKMGVNCSLYPKSVKPLHRGSYKEKDAMCKQTHSKANNIKSARTDGNDYVQKRTVNQELAAVLIDVLLSTLLSGIGSCGVGGGGVSR